MPEPTYSTDSFTPPARRGPYRAPDYFALPDEPRCELLRGRIYLTPTPDVLHQTVLGALIRQLHDLAQQAGGKLLIAPLDVQLNLDTVVQPDILYVSPERVDIVRQYIEGAPDLVVEVISPATVRLDRGGKLLAYAEADVREYWIVDPVAQHIEFLVSEGGAFKVVVPCDDRYRSAVLAGVRLDIARVWAD